MRTARQWLVSRTKVVCMISNGKAKLRGLSPCHTPSDEVLMLVMLGGNMIAENLDFPFEVESWRCLRLYRGKGLVVCCHMFGDFSFS